MKNCEKCGYQNNDDANFCVCCGASFDEVNSNNDAEEVLEIDPSTQTSSLAKVSFITGIISLGLLFSMCCYPIAIIVGPISIITGIISLVKKPKLSTTKAILGIIFGSLALVLSIILFIISGPLTDIIADAYIEYIRDYCSKNPNSQECITYKDQFPEWFK